MVALRPQGEGSLESVCAFSSRRELCTSTVRLSSRPKPPVVPRYGFVWLGDMTRQDCEKLHGIEFMGAFVFGSVGDEVGLAN
jgi:hypothetical protein